MCWLRLPVDDADDFAAWMLTSYNYQGETVSFAPGSGFMPIKKGKS
jgi:aspartate aminotransferase